MKRLLDVSLEIKINGILIGVITLIIISLSTFYIYHSGSEYYDNAERLSLQSARTLSYLPSMIDGQTLNDNADIQNIVDQYIFENDMDFVIVKDRDGAIITHPEPSMVGENEPYTYDNKARIFGASYTERTDMYSEPAIVAVAPIYAGEEARQLRGVVKVGYFESRIYQQILDKIYQLVFISLVFLIISFFVSRWFGRYIKSETLGYEPREITMILKNRDNIFSSLNEGIAASDVSGKIIYLNQAAQKYFQLKQNKEMNIYSYFDRELINDQSETGDDIKYFEKTLYDKEIVVIINNLYEKGEHSGYVFIMRDMTEMSALSNKLNVVESLFDDLRAQSHEYKNRLHLISGLLELDKYNSIREVLNEEISHLDVYQNELSEIREDRVKALIIAKKNKAKEKRINLAVASGSYMDETKNNVFINKIITIISNLIDNAIEAIAENSGSAVEVYIAHFDGWLEIIVEDDGPGIKNESEIFTKGFSTKIAGNSRGYGLYNVMTNVELLGGYIDLKSDEGKTEFIVEVPFSNEGGWV